MQVDAQRVPRPQRRQALGAPVRVGVTGEAVSMEPSARTTRHHGSGIPVRASAAPTDSALPRSPVWAAMASLISPYVVARPDGTAATISWTSSVNSPARRRGAPIGVGVQWGTELSSHAS